jgi:hypothetical protein
MTVLAFTRAWKLFLAKLKIDTTPKHIKTNYLFCDYM